MTTTYNELKERLLDLDEITLMELLEIDSEMIVERFEDIIDDKYDVLIKATEE